MDCCRANTLRHGLHSRKAKVRSIYEMDIPLKIRCHVDGSSSSRSSRFLSSKGFDKRLGSPGNHVNDDRK